jgi:hypothetical protein
VAIVARTADEPRNKAGKSVSITLSGDGSNTILCKNCKEKILVLRAEKFRKYPEMGRSAQDVRKGATFAVTPGFVGSGVDQEGGSENENS